MLSASKTAGPSGYNLTNSLRFRNSASASLTRTPGSAGNRRTFTWSAWVKRGIINAGTSPHQFLLSASTSTTFCAVDLYSNNIRVNFGNGTYLLVTTQVFRDPSSWYHIVLAVDTTQATDTNRVKLYINGSQVTAFSTAVYPAQNYDTAYNNTVAQRFAVNDATDYFDGYMAEINWVDGQALTPSSFGSTNATTGVWQPAKYTGTYGTNGFYLNFSNIALTSGSNTGLGKDYSGNGNYWNTNNISVTSGTTYDAMLDVPTNTSATVANYCVLNPLALVASTTPLSITNGNLKATNSGTGTYRNTVGTFGVSSGKWYWELQLGGYYAGVINANVTATSTYIGDTTNGWCYNISNGNVYTNNTSTAYGNTLTSSDILGVALDMDNGKIYFSKNGTWQNSGNPATSTNPAFSSLTGTLFPAVSVYDGFDLNINFGQRPFTYTPPTGFVALNTYNLPISTIVQGNKYMDAVLYTGDGTTRTVSNLGFTPDFVWTKSRSNATSHVLCDRVRGNYLGLYSDLTGAEGYNNYTQFNAAGSNSYNQLEVNNTNTYTYVNWIWKADNTSGSSNTSGSITSTVSVNASAGFSIVTYTGTGANATIGHGLGVAPKMIIIKGRSTAYDWAVYHASLGNTTAIRLNSTGASLAPQSYFWQNTTPTSSLIYLGSWAELNGSGATQVAYCWAEIAGFSKFTSFTGNGSSDGVFVYLGFLPKYIMIKSTSIAGEWAIYDIPRDLYNPMGLGGGRLQANTANAETGADSAQYIDFLSNGFKIRNSSGFDNQSGATYIVAAWASNPFKNSNAF